MGGGEKLQTLPLFEINFQSARDFFDLHIVAWLSGWIHDKTGIRARDLNAATARTSSSVAAAGIAHTGG